MTSRSSKHAGRSPLLLGRRGVPIRHAWCKTASSEVGCSGAVLASVLWLALLSPIPAAGAGGDGVWLEGETMSSDTFQFSFAANAGQTYPIAVSVDLVHWSLLTNVVGQGGPLWFAEQKAPSFPLRFYQITVPITPVTNMVYIQPDRKSVV
jgi:hypothetical protein